MPERKWPDDPLETASFGDLCDTVYEAVQFAYEMKRKNEGKDIPWSWPDQEDSPLGSEELDNEDYMKAANLEYEYRDQGRDALRAIIGCALRLGIEQGRRIVHGKQAFWVRSMRDSAQWLMHFQGAEDHPRDPEVEAKLDKLIKLGKLMPPVERSGEAAEESSGLG